MAFTTTLSVPLSVLSCLAALALVDAAPEPVAAEWSDQVFGPDGPWHAVQVTVGNDQRISLYPGREFQSFLLTSNYCSHNSSTACYATQAGLYNDAQAEVDNTGSTGSIQFEPGPDYMLGLDMDGANAVSWVDYMDVGQKTIPNVSLALLEESYVVYPDGTWYPQTVGCLGLGAPSTINQSFSTLMGPAINASLIPGYLWEHDQIPSNSFGMHIGSANPSMPGSLYFGGYDQNRIVGDIITESDDYTKAIALKDISINVIDGSSPWEFESKGGLLAANNGSIGSGGLQVSVDGCSPYLTLPKSTCDAITATLPVTYDNNLGLYIWNTDNEKYSQIVNSASALVFTFLGGSNTQNVNISVPFRHLNLTLTAPLVNTEQQYFPCYTGPSRQYALGRAFLQDAFVGANWGTKTWWLAQAPGPNVPASSVVEIANDDTEIKASANDWKESWSGSWKALTPEEANSSAAVNAPGADSEGQRSGLSTGAQAGIGVGVGIAGVALIGAIGFFFLRRRKASKNADSTDSASYNAQAAPQHGYYMPVKPPMSPDMADGSHSTVAPYNQGFAQQYPGQYSGEYPQPYGQTFTAELPAGGQVTELPGSAPFDLQSQNFGLPQGSQVSPHQPNHGAS
ncbi:aspartic peptidase domain-containing protein [Biscogniauxia marginata]|nr:aspartic peptidase domain-containing protein [Biscogniauxia marginata]